MNVVLRLFAIVIIGSAGLLAAIGYGVVRKEVVGFHIGRFALMPAASLLLCGGLPVSIMLAIWAMLDSRQRKYGPGGEFETRQCGKCGYSLAGLTGGVCPECGASGTSRASKPLVERLTLVTLMALAAAYVGAGAVELHAGIDEAVFRMRATSGGATSRARTWPFGGTRLKWQGGAVVVNQS